MKYIRRMQIMRSIRGPFNHNKCVATIGNFDGVHLGHQAVLANLVAKARELELPSTVIMFEPQPQEYFAPTQAPARLTNIREKLAVMATMGIDQVLVLRFSPDLVAMSALTFIEHILVKNLGVQFLFVGDDFHFGEGRQGDFDLLHASGDKYGFAVANTDTVLLLGERISSTRIRQALSVGDLWSAKQLLGHSYRLCGRVGHGAKRGRMLGFPTANMRLHRRISPVHGVYAVKVLAKHGKYWHGIANIGYRPTVVEGGVENHILLEVHLFGFEGDLYRNHLMVELVQHLRDERRFASIAELQHQINTDSQQAQELFACKT